MQQVPKELRSEVFDHVTETLISDAAGDTERFAKALSALRVLYATREAAGKPDPALTEALADYTDDAAEASALYRAAITQCEKFPGEPTHTKRICLASRLMDLGDTAAARCELALGRGEAERLKDVEYVELADELLGQPAG